MDHQFADQLLFILVHQFSSGIFRHLFLEFLILKRKRHQISDQFLPAAGITDNTVSGPLIYLGRSYILKRIYVEQEHIRFPGCHLFLLGRKADTAFDLMLDFYSHFSSSCPSVSPE